RVIVAPGAHDRPVVFPGWTLPGVITAGGLQSLVKTQRVVPGESIVFAGSGPLALAFPAQLRSYGANVTLVLAAGRRPSAPELLRLAGCTFDDDEDLGGPVVVRDEWLRTSVDGISAAGDGAGVTGSYGATDEGGLAALGAALDLGALSGEDATRRAGPLRRD